jgi:NAD(P)-dependent dehydrogenase (short-subunit alcohol dehydrogenase family)
MKDTNKNADDVTLDHTTHVAMVTGGANGIGAAVSQKLAAEGFVVAVTDIDFEAAESLSREIKVNGNQAYPFRLDVSDPQSIDDVFAALERQHGGCDVLVNNAGIAGVASFLDCPLEVWLKVQAVNVTAPLLCGQRAARLMARNGWGRIVNIASISGVRAGVGRTAYGTSKAALIGLTRQMAIELAESGITANCVAPGPIETPLTRDHHSPATREAYRRTVPMRRYGQPSEIADTVAFLCSPGAAYITGHTLPVDGGFLAAGLLDS